MGASQRYESDGSVSRETDETDETQVKGDVMGPLLTDSEGEAAKKATKLWTSQDDAMARRSPVLDSSCRRL